MDEAFEGVDFEEPVSSQGTPAKRRKEQSPQVCKIVILSFKSFEYEKMDTVG